MTCPLTALITITETALVLGIDPGTVCAGSESSSESRCRAAARWVRRDRGVALGLSSESDFAAADDFAFACWRWGTPVGRTSFWFSSSGELDVGSTAKQRETKVTAQKTKLARYQRFMGGKLAAKIQSAQAAINPFRAESVRFRNLPARRRRQLRCRPTFCGARLTADILLPPIRARIFQDRPPQTRGESGPDRRSPVRYRRICRSRSPRCFPVLSKKPIVTRARKCVAAFPLVQARPCRN